MKLFGAVLLALAGLTAGSAATAIVLITQIRGDAASASGSVAVTTPNTSKAAWAKLGTNLSIQNGVLNDTAGSTTTPTIAAEVPSGTMDGVNTTFVLSAAPIPNSQLIFRNGLCLFPASGDYTLAGNTITFTAAAVPQPGDNLVAVYEH